MSASPIAVQLETAEAGALQALYLGTGRSDRAPIADRLAKMGLAVTRTADLASALEALAAREFAVCVVDVSDDRTAGPWIRTIHERCPRASIVGVTDSARPLSAAEALGAGAMDLLSWPFHEADVTAMISNLRDRSAGADADVDGMGDRLVAQSAAMRQVADQVRAAAPGMEPVWLSGESGCGRETVARAIHAASSRAEGPFVVVDCAGGSPDAIEERLFGVAPEIDPSGVKSRSADRLGDGGALARAQGGSLLVRTMTAAPARAQAKLARLLRDGEALLVDRRTSVTLDVRVMIAGDEPAAAALAAGHLRRELSDRVSRVAIDVPPLRRRREDIPVLTVALLTELCRALGSTPPRVSRGALAVLAVLPWPGNGRELRALVDTMVRTVEAPVIQLEDVLAHVRFDGAPRVEAAGSLRDARARFEREWISAALMKHQGRVEEAAQTLGIQRTNLYRKIRQLNVARALLVRKS